VSQAILEARTIAKSYPGVAALKGIDLAVYPREILGVVGENGAGKSTLMKILIGLEKPDNGEIRLRGARAELEGPAAAIRGGVGMVFQEGCLMPNLSIMDNLFLCHEEGFRRWGLLSARREAAEARRQLEEVGLPKLDPRVLVGELSASQKQMVEIARLLWLSRLYGVENPALILDEPTTVLQEGEVKILFEILGALKRRASILFISHRLEEVLQISDRVCVLKDGQVVATLSRGQATTREVARLMVGHELAEERCRESLQTDPRSETVLEVQGLGLDAHFRDFRLRLRRGEIVSLVGLLGSGKEEVCRCLAGSQQPDRGKILLEGRKVRFASPKEAIAAGIGCVPIDRRNEGLATSLDVASNINLLVLRRLAGGLLLSPRRERQNAGRWVEECLIKTPSLQTLCGNLSGGNQQKVVIAKWLAAEVRVLILDHPTRGIDVGAKDEIYKRIRELAASGISLIIMCDTLEEDIGLANRLVIMKDGRVVRELDCPRGAKPAPLDVIGDIV
jgi:ribose transport system ATP-binding protein